ncbi:MAG: N,N-dimethylformamidase beta subunit family domain-containing protein, partial [Pseudomonadales bacterium]
MREYPQGRKDIAAYADRLVCVPGDVVKIMVSAEFEGNFDADLVRVVCGDARPSGTGFDLRSVASDCSGRYPARHQDTHPGSYGLISQLPEFQSLTIAFKIYPTTPERACVVLAGPGFSLVLERGRLVLEAQGQVLLRSERLLRQRRWHEVALSLAAGGAVSLQQRALGLGSGEPVTAWSEQCHAPWSRDGTTPALPAGDWWLGRDATSTSARFNGRVESLRIFQGEQLADVDALFAALPVDHQNRPAASVVAAWDFGHNMKAQEIVDLTGRYRLRLHQHPTRAVRGSRWDGSEQDWRKAPGQYGAIHFHEDDLTDAGWEADFEWQLPEDLPSGVYAVQLKPTNSASSPPEPEQIPEYVPLFVRPGRNAKRAPVALLMSTATYLAYGNQRLAAADGVIGSKPVKNPNDLYLLDHPQIGLSLYEQHQDGSGVHYASAHRPLLNMRPGSIMWSFNADTNLLAW